MITAHLKPSPASLKSLGLTLTDSVGVFFLVNQFPVYLAAGLGRLVPYLDRAF